MALPIRDRFYSRAGEKKLPLSHPEVALARPKFFGAALLNFVLYILLFFCLFSYLYGSLFQQVPRTHNIHILWVDYDGGIIRDAVRNAYSSLQSLEFPSLIEKTAAQFPTSGDLREAVCRTHYWAALYTSPGASARLAQAIAGTNTSVYNPSDVLTFVWNEVRYPTVMDGAISTNLHTLADAARVSYYALNGSSAFLTIPPNNSAALSAFTNPWTLTSINIRPTVQGTRAVYNTISFVLVLIEDFFFLATLNGLYNQFKIFLRIGPERIIIVRDAISLTFTMVSAMVNSAAIWAFKANWDVSAGQWALSWLTLWLFAHANFLIFDTFTIWIPPQFVSMALVTWIVMNITSIVFPFSVMSPFYRLGYGLPAHATYEILTDIWSNGCNPHLDYALPVLFAYEVVGLIATSIGVYKRCHNAVIVEETNKEAMRLRVEAALKMERRHSSLARQETREKRARRTPTAESSHATDDAGTLENQSSDDTEEEEEIEDDLQNVDSQIERMQSRASALSNIGPSFRLIGSND
ncbi:hypothetical protein ACQKWADRAFT_289251 [Trichoderma austrokoningii]